MDDIDVIRRVKAGDCEAFSMLVARYHRQILGFIYGLVRDSSMVEDIGQEVFLSAYKSIGNFDERRGVPFSAWLFVIARNRCMSLLRKKRGVRMIPLEEARGLRDRKSDAEGAMLEKEREQVIEDSLQLVPEPYRGTLLRSLSGMTTAEIAAADGIATGTVKSRLFRAKEKIKQISQKISGGEADEKV